jgi:hypothetical protein
MRCLVKRGGAERIYPESGEAITPWECACGPAANNRNFRT